MNIPATFNPSALVEAYRQALSAYDYYRELKAKGDAESMDEARCLLLGWGEVWELLDAIGLPVEQDEDSDGAGDEAID
ncbi:hypothetical protein [Plantactinospora endophytica]|uniref:Uncharacterized protein n=1 Tax=Plantactinospora endophytica TaxID=673535 RepID=A0ABQ4ECG4_9ACTN|nr:hypothetical protein [Plantactinospora endophytica]GIG92376.1 hypothetical protein Pen02_73120 [Plantactinospora endophytica]